MDLFLSLTLGVSSAGESSPPMKDHPLGLGGTGFLEKVTMTILSFLLEAYMCLILKRCQKGNVVSVDFLR